MLLMGLLTLVVPAVVVRRLIVIMQDVVMKDVVHRIFGRIDDQHLIVPDRIFIFIRCCYGSEHPLAAGKAQLFPATSCRRRPACRPIEWPYDALSLS